MVSRLIVSNNKVDTGKRILTFLEQYSNAVFLGSNTDAGGPVPVTGIRYDFIGAAGVVDEIIASGHDLSDVNNFLQKHRAAQNWVFGYLTYDIKNQIENLSSQNTDHIDFPEFHFFVPQYLFIGRNREIEIISHAKNVSAIADEIFGKDFVLHKQQIPSILFSYIPDRDKYLEAVSALLKHIQIGNIYEVNYCHQLVGIADNFNPMQLYLKLVELSPNPFSCFYKLKHNYLLCASPERFVMKSGNKIYSQPIKGTSARGKDATIDDQNKSILAKSEKEQSENVMITDLVRNDLSKIAVKGSVKVEELFGVYTFKRVHQMISTISCQVKPDVEFADIIRATFPMGSMTGAPKVSAMKLIEQFEEFKRGLFSGSVGYISPDGEFDFNVVIRSILFNEKTRKVAVAAGGAITSASDPVREYEETLLKLTPQLQALGLDANTVFDSHLHLHNRKIGGSEDEVNSYSHVKK